MFYNVSQVQQEGSGSLGTFTRSHPAVAKQRSHDFILQDQACKLLPSERVCNCLKKRIDKDKKRSVMYNESREKAHYANVQRCGSVWHCPVCAKQITEKRRNELKQGVEKWRSDYGDVLLLTLTVPHTQHDYLYSLLEFQKKALKNFFSNRKGISLFKKLGKKHHIRSFECTYGQNGWHPHYHFLIFTDRKNVSNYIKESNIYNELLDHWKSCCERSGLPIPNEHGLDIRDGSYASKYVSKWGLESEMTKGHLKKGRNSYTAFDLLQQSLDDDIVLFNKHLSSTLFQEFAITMKRRRQLCWSRGLKKLLGIDEKTDQELAEETDKEAIKLLDVSSLLFDLLCKYQKRHEFLTCLENDYKNGCFGRGSTELLIADLVNREIESLSSADLDHLLAQLS